MIEQLLSFFLEASSAKLVVDTYKKEFAIALFEIGEGLTKEKFYHQEEPCSNVLRANSKDLKLGFGY